MSKIFALIFTAFLLTGCGIAGGMTSNPSATVVPQGKSTVVIDFGDGKISTYSGIIGKTAFDVLTDVAVTNEITMDVKKYDFGMLLNSLGGKENSKDMAWIYFVNGKSPEVGADKYNLKDGDVVEWKYTKPTF